MNLLDLSLGLPFDDIALDEALLLAAERGTSGEVLRIWESAAPCVVLGAGCRLAADTDEAACVADGVPIVRRASGGGTVLLGRGCLAYSLILAYDRLPELKQVGSSYEYILARICRGLAVPGLEPAGISDLAFGSRKVSGNAQQRKRNHLLHHGTLLYAFDMSRVGRYLRSPARQPAYRRQRPDTEFLTNLPLGRSELISRLSQVFGATQTIHDWPGEVVRELVESKYGRGEWTRRL